jgi:Ca-activated chloride channel family protein
MTFADPLWFLLALPVAWLLRVWSRTPRAAMLMPVSTGYISASGWRTGIRKHLQWFHRIALALLIIAMARPQRLWTEEKVKADALDIILAMDISPSMLSRDFEPDRLAVAKQVAIDFVEKRPHDRIGLVAFSAEAFTQCPLTADKKMVQNFIRELTVGRLEDGTAIGMGLATALNRIKTSAAKSKIVILLTDGENNAGDISPVQAAEIAGTLGIRVYTVGIGTEGYVMSPVQRAPNGSYLFSPRFVTFDTELLQQMAAMTNGRFFRAYSERDLAGIYNEIDRLEKTRIEVNTLRRTTELAGYFIIIALLFIFSELMLRWFIVRTIII